jgi:hypothetical protein
MIMRSLCLAVCLMVPTAVAAGKEAMPMPPAENPHPPVTSEDKAKAAFADDVVKSFLQTELTLPAGAAARGTAYASKDEACLKDPACWQKDGAFVGDLQALYRELGPVVETKHTHVVPAATPRKLEQKGDSRDEPPAMLPLKDDEYAVHMYVRTAKRYGWSDLSVVLTGGAGKPALRRIIVAPMQSAHHLPPGAKC